ncbi:N-acetyl-gamma-glutamyl-phosphate reductase [Anoxynatronum buryatiense]|uniref:N-acetyl-gamma-glutamyl-phosphate reductase n=1 Tax=Anoxynatronum buryatiense TaxID=489973 RepID=A0AA46AHK5_9CLOT|nr:N-acetyl-gamma-glutamyl-phosphate reductase [Anoxynatronum buryatiense]SMP40483.1 N-acetyl-gamma-glutamyl-phosphate reductase [Anoxynatronum buryatiense]
MKAGILGSTGYTGAELVRILIQHPEVELAFVDSRSYEHQPFEAVYSNLKGQAEMTAVSVDPENLPEKVDIVFCALPHRISQHKVILLQRQGIRVVDLSADFRLDQQSVYEQWYNTPHEAPELLEKAVYGLPEWYAEELKETRLAANPGCFPTSILLPLLPLLKENLVTGEHLVIDSKTGVSGAGRGPSAVNVFSQVNENVRAYGIGTHRHTPEIEQELSKAAGKSVTLQFTPHLVPMDRGILSTIVMPLPEGLTERKLQDCYQAYYDHKPFIRLLGTDTLPETKAVRGSNFCDIAWKADRRSGNLILVSVIDNLIKGSSGEAVQNMNLMLGLPEEMGLHHLPIWP